MNEEGSKKVPFLGVTSALLRQFQGVASPIPPGFSSLQYLLKSNVYTYLANVFTDFRRT